MAYNFDGAFAAIPCAYGTAENMLRRAIVGADDFVLVAGASGGVGSAAVQLAKRRGAKVVAITRRSKMDQLRDLGADVVIERDENLVMRLGESSIDVVVDTVAGPVVSLDMRDMYLKDISHIGCTAWDAPVFPNSVSNIENNEIRPLVAKVFP